jgi:hypothetical protein
MLTRGLFPQVSSDEGLKLTIHLHKMPMSRMMELFLHSPIRLHGIGLNFVIMQRISLPREYIHKQPNMFLVVTSGATQ